MVSSWSHEPSLGREVACANGLGYANRRSWWSRGQLGAHHQVVDGRREVNDTFRQEAATARYTAHAAPTDRRTTSVGRSACCATALETLPSSNERSPVSPREPMTI